MSPFVPRITLSVGRINASREIFFLSIDPKKWGIIRQILAETNNAKDAYPAAWIKAKEKLSWFVVRP